MSGFEGQQGLSMGEPEGCRKHEITLNITRSSGNHLVCIAALRRYWMRYRAALSEFAFVPGVSEQMGPGFHQSCCHQVEFADEVETMLLYQHRKYTTPLTSPFFASLWKLIP